VQLKSCDQETLFVFGKIVYVNIYEKSALFQGMAHFLEAILTTRFVFDV